MNPHCLRRTVTHAAALIAGCAGIWVCGLLVKHDARIWPEASDGIYARVCQVWTAAAAECAKPAGRGAALAVPLPRFSSAHGLEIRPMRVPLAFLGMAYFVALTAWLCVMGPPRRTDPWWRHAPRALATAGSVASATLLVRMLIGGAPPCVWCALAHLLNFVLTASLWATVPWPEVAAGEPAAAALRRARTRLAGVAVGVAVLAVGGLGYHRHEQLALGRHIHILTPYRDTVVALRNDSDYLLREHYAAAPQDIPQRLGALDGLAPTSVVVFTDYSCTACRCTDRRLQALLADAFVDPVHITVRHAPQCRECAMGKTPGPHGGGCYAACAAEAARVVGGDEAFERMHEALVAEGGAWTPSRINKLAERLGLDAGRFQAALVSDAVRADVAADVAAARALGVEAAPAVFLDGRRVGPLSVDNPVFWRAVAAGDGPDGAGHVVGLRIENP